MLTANSVFLRKVNPSDLDRVHELLSNMDVVRWMSLPLSQALEQSEGFLNDTIRESMPCSWDLHTRAICDPNTGELIGLCGVCFLAASEQGELWYLLRPPEWGHGCATDAARQLLAFGFDELKLHRIWARCAPENPASMRVLAKLGMRQEGREKSSLKLHGVWRDCYLYAVLADEWRERAA